jgi:hypothetical protein
VARDAEHRHRDRRGPELSSAGEDPDDLEDEDAPDGASADDADAADDAEEADDDEDAELADDDDEDDPPRVVIGKVSAIASWLSPRLAHAHRHRPIWFVLAMDEDLVGVFERLPEGPFDAKASRDLMAGLRAFASEKSDELQGWLGPTDGIVVGLHGDAAFADVARAFEEDGFLVVGELVEGRVVARS